MLGHLMEWFYAGLAGIKQTRNSVAFKSIEIRPQPVGNITYAKASYHSPYGEIVSEWKLNGNSFELDVEVPANTIATVYLPANKEYQKPLKIGSGKYKFTVTVK